ncbi:hypothetical protein CROQUDRAFT_671878 [Cronartium quercuum f. sp. fusiforme G11]|uniref:Protein AF-9 homolog n=1 Tax=Cronartium quercuum f. sp. fusiforme G11 TaxID=708437 RepID=A0A9P6NJE1_9BASI|nr:hypothetical protein CROQUDRAFT_671878 [Cronartium quercuum f. sp. fusiforme G11]
MADKRRMRGIAIHRPIIYGSVATVIPEEERIENPSHNMRWTVAVRSATSPPPDSEIFKTRKIQDDILGGQDDLSKFIRKVTFKLHESYPNHIRTIDREPFEISETGWGEFIILIKIFFVTESGEKPIQIHHPLKLHPWIENPLLPLFKTPWLDQTPDDLLKASESINSPIPNHNHTQHSNVENSKSIEMTESPFPPSIHSWQYDEIVFTEPTESLYQKLIESPPTPLPLNNRFSHHYVKQIGSKGESGEFTLEIEKNEYKKLNWSNLKILIEIDKLRGKLIRDERELAELKRELQVL